MIYFDNAATTRALPAVAEKMSTMLCEQYGNPASVSAMGLAAEKEIRNAAEIIARGIRCKYDEVFFTSGGTEGDNWAIYGTAEGYKRQGQHFITTEIESIGVFIGPEGGFAEEEIALAKENGITPITLGKRILRTETAGMTTTAILLYELD